jgi:predicted metal-dependent hydrolase
LEVRDRNYNYDELTQPYYDAGNIILTSEWETLGLIIPCGERFFIRSVQRLAPKAKKAELKVQINGFIGQEAMHAKETERSIEPLIKRGFPASQVQAFMERTIAFFERIIPARLALAGTAAIEHHTAVLSLWHLSTQYSRKHIAPPYRQHVEWHGAEELEHKAVAFDLLQEVAPNNYLLRAVGFLLAMMVVWISFLRVRGMILKWEGLTRAQIHQERKKARKIRMSLMSPGLPYLWLYLKPGFHPNDLEDGGLSKKILAEQAARAVG